MQHVHNIFDTVARLSVLTLAALTPVFFVPGVFVTIPQAKLALASVLIGVATLCWCLARVFEREVRLPRHIIFFAVLLLPLAYVASALIAGWPMAAVVGGLGEQDTVVTALLLSAACLITGIVLHGSTIGLVSGVRAVAAGSLALVLVHIGRLFFPELLSFGGVFPNATASAAGSWHDLGIVLSLIVVLCAFLLSTRVAGKKLWRVLFIAAGTLSFLFLVVISMQDIWFVLAGVMSLFGVYTWFAGGSSEGRTWSVRSFRSALWLAVALIAFLFGWFNTAIHDFLPQPFQIVSVEVRPSWEGTVSVGQSSLTNPQSLVFGTGPNSFARNWAHYKPTGVNNTLFWNLDFANGVGVVPTSLVTIGILGIGAWILLAAAFVWSAGGALRTTKLFEHTQMVVFGFVCAIVLLLAFHVMYAPGIAVSLLLFLLLGMFLAIPLEEPRPIVIPLTFDSVSTATQWVPTVALAGIIVFASTVSVFALTSDVLVNRSVALYNQNGNSGESSALIQKALRVWPSNDRAHRAAVELGILELSQLAHNAGTDEATRSKLEATLSGTIEHGLRAVSIDRADYQNWLTLAQLYQELAGAGIEGAYEQAQQAYASARQENPTNPLPLFRLAQLEIARGNTSIAIERFDDALALKSDFAPAHFLRSQLLAQQNRLDDAIASAVAAVQIVPEDPLGWYNLGVILYLKESFNEAGAAFAQAVTLRNDYSNALFMLGLTYHKVGVPDQAVAALTRVVELNPQEQSVNQMIANIRAGADPFGGLSGN